MAITVDAATEHVRTGTTSPQTFSHAGAASGVRGVVLSLVHGVSSTDHVTAASYGGVAMTRIQRNTDTATEPGAAELWFLGTSVPQGTQTLSYTPGATTDDFHAVVITLLADDDTEVLAQGGINNNAANPSVALAYAGRSGMAFGALYGGGASPASFTPNANCETVHDHDLGAFYSEVIRQSTAGTADFAIGGTATGDDVAFAAIAVAEVIVSVHNTSYFWPKYWQKNDTEVDTAATNILDTNCSGYTGKVLTRNYATPHPERGQHFTLEFDYSSAYEITHSMIRSSAFAPAQTGLEWDGNEVGNPRSMLYWANPFPIYPATYIFRVFPKGPKSGVNRCHWTMFFWGNNGPFVWGPDYERSYYGGHPYPFDGPSASTNQKWEISVDANDFPPPVPYNVEIEWNRWYTQVFRVWQTADPNQRHLEFYFDWPDTAKVNTYTGLGLPITPTTPCICVGQAPDQSGVGANSGSSWGGYPGYETYKGIIRGMQFYNQLLTLQQITDEVVIPGSAVAPWYLNLNPIPTDVADKSGNGNHPLWDGVDRPTLWQG